MVMLHINLKLMMHGSTYFAFRHKLNPGGGVKTIYFLKVVMLHIKLKRHLEQKN